MRKVLKEQWRSGRGLGGAWKGLMGHGRVLKRHWRSGRGLVGSGDVGSMDGWGLFRRRTIGVLD